MAGGSRYHRARGTLWLKAWAFGVGIGSLALPDLAGAVEMSASSLQQLKILESNLKRTEAEILKRRALALKVEKNAQEEKAKATTPRRFAEAEETEAAARRELEEVNKLEGRLPRLRGMVARIRKEYGLGDVDVNDIKEAAEIKNSTSNTTHFDFGRDSQSSSGAGKGSGSGSQSGSGSRAGSEQKRYARHYATRQEWEAAFREKYEFVSRSRINGGMGFDPKQASEWLARALQDMSPAEFTAWQNRFSLAVIFAERTKIEGVPQLVNGMDSLDWAQYQAYNVNERDLLDYVVRGQKAIEARQRKKVEDARFRDSLDDTCKVLFDSLQDFSSTL